MFFNYHKTNGIFRALEFLSQCATPMSHFFCLNFLNIPPFISQMNNVMYVKKAYKNDNVWKGGRRSFNHMIFYEDLSKKYASI
jgi:hypothetical protein